MLQGFFFELFWHAVCRGSSSVISPALSHLQSLLCSRWRTSILYGRPSTQSTHWIMWSVATELMVFLKNQSPSAKGFSTLPRVYSCKPFPFTTHGHMIAAHWACPLMIARARVHNIHTWRGSSNSPLRVRHNKCKGRTEACNTCFNKWGGCDI